MTTVKLLFVSEQYPPAIGGVATSAGRISRSIVHNGHGVDVFTLARDLSMGVADSRHQLERLRVHRFGMAKNPDFTLQQSLTFLEWLNDQRKFDAVWGHYIATAGFLATWLGNRKQVPVILSVRGNDLDKELFPPGDFARLLWCLKKCTLVVAASRDLASKVHTLADREAAVLPNAVDSDLFTPGERCQDLLTKYAVQPGELVIGFSGELRAKKGLPFLIQAFRELLARQPARLLIIGEVRANDRGEFERMLADEELRKQVIITGHIAEQEEVARHIRLCDVMLFPSLWEGMPNSLLEAMACGVPVVASDAGAIPEVVTDGVTGMLVPRTHLHLLAERVDELLSMPGDSRRGIVAAARRHVCEFHSPAAEQATLHTLLDGFGA